MKELFFHQVLFLYRISNKKNHRPLNSFQTSREILCIEIFLRPYHHSQQNYFHFRFLRFPSPAGEAVWKESQRIQPKNLNRMYGQIQTLMFTLKNQVNYYFQMVSNKYLMELECKLNKEIFLLFRLPQSKQKSWNCPSEVWDIIC